jgi:NAD(P)-dependent dehydrogenase (short-subunit alcohol dehydrogenase family)
MSVVIPSQRVDGKVVLITGCGAGIGRALACVALGLRVQDEGDDRREHDQPDRPAAPEHPPPT